MIGKRRNAWGIGGVRAAARKIAPFWVSMVVIGSFLPGSMKLALGTKPYEHHHPVELQHRILHFVTFGATTLLFELTAGKRNQEILFGCAAFLLGCVIEATQFGTGLAEVFEWWDVRDDLIATVAALIIYEAARWLRLRSTAL
jgi:hypothetical protein